MLLQTNSYLVPKDKREEHQRLIRRHPVGEHRPLRTVPLLELHAATPLMITTGEGERWKQPLRPQPFHASHRHRSVGRLVLAQ